MRDEEMNMIGSILRAKSIHIKELEAKLAKAVKALQTIKDWPDFRLPIPQDIARTTLAELKGQADE
jgi:hypothetical protein